MSDILYLIMGPSGCGKTTIANKLADKHGLKILNSYTTRAKRYASEEGHIFIDPESYTDFDDLKTQYPNRVAETIFNGHFYFATSEQVDESDIYIIDPAGIDYFKTNYCGKKKCTYIYLYVPEEELRTRMSIRGDKDKDIDCRIKHDQIAFKNATHYADIVLANYGNMGACDYLSEGITHGKF